MKFLAILATLLPLVTFSSDPLLAPKSDLPVEFSYLVESFQQYPLQDSERENLSNVLKKLDKLFTQMTKEEVYFILKSEIYKELLNKPRLSQQSQLYDKKILKKFAEIIDTKIENYHQFAKWIIIATYSDLKQIFDSPYFNTFIVEKKGIGLKNPNAAMIEKKLNLVLPWYEDIVNQNPEEFHEMLKPLLLVMLDKITIKIEYLLVFSRFEKIQQTPDDNLRYFEIKIPMPKEAIKDPLLDIDLSAIKPAEQPIKDQWLPRNEPMEPNPNYIPPENLPVPSDDW
jgi:hypothetical protein